MKLKWEEYLCSSFFDYDHVSIERPLFLMSNRERGQKQRASEVVVVILHGIEKSRYSSGRFADSD